MLSSVIALNRFGLGARPGDQPPADPKPWLFAASEPIRAAPQPLAYAPTRPEVATQLADYLAEQRKRRPRQATAPAAGEHDERRHATAGREAGGPGQA